METLALVKPTAKEQLFAKITEVRQKNLTAAQIKEIKEIKEILAYYFKVLVWKHFGLSKEQILKFSDQEIEALQLLVLERVQKKFIFLWTLQITVPIFGWLIASDTDTMKFKHYLRKIKKMLGGDLNLGRILREELANEAAFYYFPP